MAQAPYVTIRSRGMVEGSSQTNFNEQSKPRSATHDISRVSYHMKEVGDFAQTLEDSAARAFPNRGQVNQRYKKVQALLLHWRSDDLFVLPELEDLGKCLREDYGYETDIFPIPSENSHLELMMRMGQLIKEHEAQDTLFIVYYGGHARIDESRQSRWCATRNPDSPWLQWSAIQTLLERSLADVLILLDCCAGAASATFPSGSSITETISASSWDAIAPDPGRYSFTNALIEVLQEWRHRTFSAAMVHAEVLARLKHPRPIMINGKYFEARSTPVHFMMTSNHKAPSIEIARIFVPEQHSRSTSRPVSPVRTLESSSDEAVLTPETGSPDSGSVVSEPSEDVPHVMISLALEGDQRLDLSAWEHWLQSFPALAKYVKVQGVFKSHSTLLLLSMPVMIWDLLPDDHATSFVAFIRSNNLAMEKPQPKPTRTEVRVTQRDTQTTGPRPESEFFDDNTTITPSVRTSVLHTFRPATSAGQGQQSSRFSTGPSLQPSQSFTSLPRQDIVPSPTLGSSSSSLPVIYNAHRSGRRTTFVDSVPEQPLFSPHIHKRLEFYYDKNPHPSDAERDMICSNMGIDTLQVEAWYHHRRERDGVREQLSSLHIDDKPPSPGPTTGPMMILPAHLNDLLNLSLPGQVLAVDLRSQSEFEKSRIHGAINLRMPIDFLHNASPNLLARAFADDQSRREFSKWDQARCLVFYYKGLDFPWECPAAEVLYEKFRYWGWTGRCFVLKGHFREFSVNFDKFIDGTKMTKEAKEYIDSLRAKSVAPSHRREADRLYGAWFAAREAEGRLCSTPAASDLKEKRDAVERHERNLRAEFEASFSDLYKKATDHPDNAPATPSAAGKGKGEDAFNERSAQMVEHLDRGLARLRDGKATSPAGSAKGKGVEGGYFDGAYVDYAGPGKGDDRNPVTHGDDEDFPKKGRSSGGNPGGLLNRVLRRP